MDTHLGQFSLCIGLPVEYIERPWMSIVKLLINRVQIIDVKNSAGLTAFDMLEYKIQSHPEFEEVLHKCGSLEVSSFSREKIVDYLRNTIKEPRPPGCTSWFYCRRFFHDFARFYYRRKKSTTNEIRNIVLVVAVLIATATYQVALAPPEDTDTKPKELTVANATATNGTTTEGNPFLPDFFLFPEILKSSAAQIFMYCNGLAFYTSMLTIHFHLPRHNLKLVYPLVICFLLLIAARSDISLLILFGVLFPALSFSHLPLNILLRCKRKNLSVQAMRSIFKHYRSFYNEMQCNSTVERE
ncbi:hypothetical protein Patl1_04867 [Pistacia atlantica]|uniref:Uncharacterized protein n=1 Tax=Pistacia atlantica TaxID=434234 RepID=A0ACC1BQD0_9ROSI|nr:hypothetical protein Patl1_04867 [Pistacia atlantica]